MNWLNRNEGFMSLSKFNSVRRHIARAVALTTRVGKYTPARLMVGIGLVLAIPAIFFIRSQRASSPLTPPRPPRASQVQLPLVGYVDMHTHPMSHLGFGKKLMHGAPDIGSIVPKGTRFCNNADFRAKNIGEALGNCNSTHGGWGTDNTCGDTLRAAIINLGIDDEFKHKLPPEENLHGDHKHPGNPAFQYWPHQTSLLHQQMWVDWIRRAHEGGLRVMVALSVNNQLLAEAINGDEPKQDKPSSDLQIKEIKSFVGRHNDFMEVAYSPEDLRRIVGSGKLAVVLGMEVDDFGGFLSDPIFYLHPEYVKQALVKAEIKRVHDLGVRYIFPIHLTNNVFGGTAAYSVLFNFANKHNTGKFLKLEHTSDSTIDFDMNFFPGIPNNAVMLGLGTALEAVGELPAPCINDISCLPGGKVRCCSNAMNVIKNAMKTDAQWTQYHTVLPGQINAQGLTPLGEFAIKEMMKMGIIIDLDHMGRKSITDALELAEGFNGGYPVNFGHNNLRKNDGKGTERNISGFTAHRIGKLGGMIGVGTAGLTADQFIDEYLKMVAAAGNDGDVFVAPGIGTDANGLEPLPKGSTGLNSAAFYSNGFTKAKTGERTWDYTKEGVAHYGLMKDFFQDVKTRKLPSGAGVYSRVRQSAEYFARMWEKCEDTAGVN
jgi:microsomal dipeptidase-like Zn-dependent dipeptidase